MQQINAVALASFNDVQLIQEPPGSNTKWIEIKMLRMEKAHYDGSRPKTYNASIRHGVACSACTPVQPMQADAGRRLGHLRPFLNTHWLTLGLSLKLALVRKYSISSAAVFTISSMG